MYFMKLFRKIGFFVVLSFIGCILLGYGLFLLWGLDHALSIIGTIFLVLGLFGEFMPIFLKTGG